MFKANRYAASKPVDLPVNGNQVTAIAQLEAQANTTSPLEAFKSEGVVLIGKGTKIRGEIVDSSMLDIQGDFEGDVAANSVIVREGASFKGNMHTQHVEVHGLLEGTLITEELLDIRPTGCVNAEVRYGELSVATGACLTGSIQSQEKTDSNKTVEEPFVEAAIMNGINGRHVSIN